MRRRDIRVYLADVREAASAIAEFLDGRGLDDYRDDRMLRSAVERQFEIIGEALNRALKVDPTLGDRLPAARGAIDFRNVVTHDYDRLADEHVYDIATGALPRLAEDVARELEHRG
ncbi:MAG: hypothetical protein C0418_05130 [Coriobacteriaceae bacterium]|nr:hypothetical protein [Coriobacteriaceae bacterium]